MTHDPHDPTINTKWGRITSQEWFRLRSKEQLDKWFGPVEMHYILTRTPYHEPDGKEIIDHAFIALLQRDPVAAHQQLLHEEIAFDNDLAIRRRRRKEAEQQEQAQRQEAIAELAASRRRQRKASNTSSPTQHPAQLTFL